uniref:MFS domain-containing protein n=1 Tax=Elaeophora elaphi TaxID=1147741 RepID=A0A0R3RK46_9BILA
MNTYRILVFSAFIFISATSVLPWNLFINAHEYYHYKLRNITENLTLSDENNDDTELQRSYEGWVTLTGGVSCAFGSGINFLTTGRNSAQLTFFCISMLLASLASFGSIGLIACGLLGFSAKFPPENVQAVMIGQSVAGILSSLLSILCQSLAANALINGRFFFSIAFIWTVLSVFFYELLIRSEKIESLLVETGDRTDQSSDQRLLGLTQNFTYLDSVDDSFEGGESPLHSRSVETRSLWNDAQQVWKKTKREWWACFIVLFGTVIAFPALSSLVQTTAKNLVWKSYFSSFACFLLFNCGDALGRLVMNFVSM